MKQQAAKSGLLLGVKTISAIAGSSTSHAQGGWGWDDGDGDIFYDYDGFDGDGWDGWDGDY